VQARVHELLTMEYTFAATGVKTGFNCYCPSGFFVNDTKCAECVFYVIDTGSTGFGGESGDCLSTLHPYSDAACAVRVTSVKLERTSWGVAFARVCKSHTPRHGRVQEM